MSGAQRPVLELLAPFEGTVVALADVPDPVYARGVVGPGLAVLPDPDVASLEVTAPCDGLVHAILPHAVMLVADHGRQVLVHLGVRAVDHHVRERSRVGDRLVVGQPMLLWEVERSRTAGAELASPVVALQAPAAQVLAVVEPGDRVERGQALLFWS